MKSPFPGMDPFLEQHWRSVHHRLITYAGDHLQSVLPQGFRVEVEERVFVADDGGGRSLYPDAYVVDHPSAGKASASAVRDTAIAEPIVIQLADEPLREASLEIIDTTSGHRVITALEFLSPTNKRLGDGHDLYVHKQRDCRAGRVSLVEIDLTRSGDRGLVLPLPRIPSAYRTVYLACVRRSWSPGNLEIYPMPLPQRLPTIGIPLREGAGDAPLDLQAIVDECYLKGRYADFNYSRDPVPPLDEHDAAWAAELLRSQGLR